MGNRLLIIEYTLPTCSRQKTKVYHCLRDSHLKYTAAPFGRFASSCLKCNQLIIDGSKIFILLGNQEATLSCYMAVCFSFASMGTSVLHGGEKLMAFLWLLLTGGLD